MNRLFGFVCIGLLCCQQSGNTGKQSSINSAVVDSISMTMTAVEEKRYSLDEVYLKYLSEDLQTYIQTTHPSWQVPNQNLWYPQLFNKYKTNHSLVNYISGDFDGNGKTDHALIIDKGRNDLAVVAFLRVDSTFKTVELTVLSREGEKINYVLTLYKPGRYTIADPDLGPTDKKQVILKSSSVGIGLFKELYEGGDDVYYWNNGELRSCVIEK